MQEENPNQNPTRLQALLALLDYHRKAMEVRRSIAFKAFLALVGLDLLLVKGAFEIRGGVMDLDAVKNLVSAAYWFLFTLYLVFVFQVEKQNRFNRHRYTKIEERIWQIADIEPRVRTRLPSASDETLWGPYSCPGREHCRS